MPAADDAVDRLAAAIGEAADARPDRALRVAVTGITGSGKTTLAARLRPALVRRGRSVFDSKDLERPVLLFRERRV